MKSAIFLSVRNKATRLPGKALLDLGGRPVTEQLIRRLRTSREADLVVLTTSTHPDDEVLADLARRAGVEAFRGSEDDKLDRYLRAARRYGVDLAVVVDGDDPLCDPDYIDRLIRTMRTSGADFGTIGGLPVGLGANAFTSVALARVCEIKTEQDTEVWGGYFTQTGLFTTCTVEADAGHRDPELRLTLDYPEDYEVFTTIFSRLGGADRVFGLDEVFELVRARPGIKDVNREAAARYEANLKRITRIGIRPGVTA